MAQLELRDCRLPSGLPNQVVRIQGKKIVAIGPASAFSDQWPHSWDVQNRVVLPGLCDCHVHDRNPGGYDSEGVDHLAAACELGGVVWTGRMPNTNPPLTTFGDLFSPRWAGKERCSFWFGATPDNAEQIRQAVRHPRCSGVKMYMGSSTGDLLVKRFRDQLCVFGLCAELGATLAVHAEDEDTMLQNRQLLGRQMLVSDHCLVRAWPVEVEAVNNALAMARMTGCRVHFCHISSPQALQIIRDAKDTLGDRITVEVCPHHLFLDEARCSWPGQGGFFKMNPPLRSWPDVLQMQEYVCRPDFVDMIASDHAPHPADKKRGKVLDEVPSGVPGVQTILPMMMRFVKEGRMSLKRLVELTSTNPFKLLGMPNKGKLEVGYDADLVVCNPDGMRYARDEYMLTKCGWTPFHGLAGYGWPEMVIVGGKILLDSKTGI